MRCRVSPLNDFELWLCFDDREPTGLDHDFIIDLGFEHDGRIPFVREFAHKLVDCINCNPDYFWPSEFFERLKR